MNARPADTSHPSADQPHRSVLLHQSRTQRERIGANSPLIDRLIGAAHAGKQVTVLVELKARVDERNNIQWTTRLEAYTSVYGVEGLKTHCKLCLVVRKEAAVICASANRRDANRP